RTKPSILSSETSRIFALIGSLCSTGSMRINPPADCSCPITAFAERKSERFNRFAPLSRAAGEKREEMATRTGEDEQMPNEMAIAETLVHEKEYACGVGDATGYQPEQRSGWKRQRDRTNGDKRQPPRAKIESHREFGMTRSSARRLQGHAENRECPNKYEYCRAPKAAKQA